MGIYKFSKVRTRRCLKRLGMEDMYDQVIKVANQLESKEKHPINMTLTKDFYPVIEDFNGKTKCAIETEWSKMLHEKYLANKQTFNDILDTNEPPTLKKFLQLLLIEVII